MTLGLDAYASSDGNEDEDIVPTRLARSVAAAPNVDSGALALERDEDSGPNEWRVVPLASTTTVILYVVRLAARFDNYVSFLLQAAISRLYLAYISPIAHHISPT